MAGLRPIAQVAQDLGLESSQLVPCGRDVLKVELSALEQPRRGRGRLVLVSAITPTKHGEGKTVVSIGLSMGLAALGRRSAVCLREPSLGPVFGLKGGGTGGGAARVHPAEAIDLHFTGDLHAVTSAHNLLAALLDDDLRRGRGALDPRRVTWRRAIDMNDRALRRVMVGLEREGLPRETGFDITAASEVMISLQLSESLADLRSRLSRIVVGASKSGHLITAGELGADAAMTLLLRDAILPNLVQTSEGTPAFVDGAAFANVGHGTSSVIATRMAMHTCDDVVVEAGFGFDLGGEKFLHIKCRSAGIWPHCVVVVATVRALAKNGRANLDQHLNAVEAFGLPAVVAINVFPDDREADLADLEAHCAARGVRAARFEGFARGGAGAEALATVVGELLDGSDPPEPRYLYPLEASYAEKLRALASTVHGTEEVQIEPSARGALRRFSEAGHDRLPVCIAKSPFRIGKPLKVKEVRLAAGAGFVLALAGKIDTMPGLPKKPRARAVDIDGSGGLTWRR